MNANELITYTTQQVAELMKLVDPKGTEYQDGTVLDMKLQEDGTIEVRAESLDASGLIYDVFGPTDDPEKLEVLEASWDKYAAQWELQAAPVKEGEAIIINVQEVKEWVDLFIHQWTETVKQWPPVA